MVHGLAITSPTREVNSGALVRTDRRAFVLVTDASTELSYLLEVTAAGVIRLSVPANIRAYALHDLGTTAPRYSMSR